MLIARDHINEAALRALGAEAVNLPCSGQSARLTETHALLFVADNGAKAQVELIVTCNDSEVHVTLEQISTGRVDGSTPAP
ncbi:MAG: hypothetical protein V7631_580 [Massilia sp.]|jgi:hypothetical protein